jgi:hypothetical protein
MICFQNVSNSLKVRRAWAFFYVYLWQFVRFIVARYAADDVALKVQRVNPRLSFKELPGCQPGNLVGIDFCFMNRSRFV